MTNLYQEIFQDIEKFKVSEYGNITPNQAQTLENDVKRLNERLFYLFGVAKNHHVTSDKLENLAYFAKNTENGRGSKLVKGGHREFINLNYENAEFLYQQMKEIHALME